MYTFFFNLHNHPSFHSEESLVHLERERECFVGLSILLAYGYYLYAIDEAYCKYLFY